MKYSANPSIRNVNNFIYMHLSWKQTNRSDPYTDLNLTIYKYQKLQFIQSIKTINCDGSKTAKKSLKSDINPPSHRLNVSVMLRNITILMIFAFDPLPLTLCYDDLIL